MLDTNLKTRLKLFLFFFTKLKIPIEHCTGQSYDNAVNMSGHFNAIQCRIKDINPKAKYEYILYSEHSLGVVGTCAAESCLDATRFFDLLQKLFTFFHVQQTVEGNIRKGKIVKSLSITRWIGRALYDSYDGIKNELKMAYEKNPTFQEVHKT